MALRDLFRRNAAPTPAPAAPAEPPPPAPKTPPPVHPPEPRIFALYPATPPNAASVRLAANHVRGVKSINFHLGAVSPARNAMQIAAAYNETSILYTIVRRIATDTAAAPIKLCRDNGDEIERHPVLDLLKNPRPGNTSLWRDLIMDTLLYGCCFAEATINKQHETMRKYGLANARAAGGIQDMWRISPADIQIKATRRSALPQEIIVGLNERFRIAPDGKCNIFYHLDYSPDTQGITVSAPTDAAAKAIQAYQAMQEYQQTQAERGYSPIGLIKLGGNKEGVLNQQTVEAFRKTSDEKWEEARHKQTPVVLAEAEFQQISQTPRDVDFISGKDSIARDICMVYSMPPQIIGLKDSQSYRNMAESRQAYFLWAILPVADAFYKRLTQWARQHYPNDADFNIEVDTNLIPALNERRVAAAAQAEGISYMTYNEKRRMAGLSDIPEGDVIIVKGGQTLEDVIDPPDDDNELPPGDEPPGKKPKPPNDDDSESKKGDKPTDGK